MKAVRLHEYGAPDVLVYEDVPTPQPGPGQVLIKVEAAAVNYSDVMRRRNDPYPFPTPLPFISGGEVAGTIEQLGAGVAEPAVGTRVFATVGYGGPGGYAQYAVANVGQAVPIPPGLSVDQACALVVAGATAMLTMTGSAQLQGGESVLVPAAAGGVGSYAVQVAKLLGAGTVIAAASTPEKRARALQLGADHAVDYTQPGWPDRVREITDGRGVDVVLEMSGGRIFEQSLACLAPFGRAVVYGFASGEHTQLSPQTLINLLYSPAENQSLIAFNLGGWFSHRPQLALSAIQTLIGWVMEERVRVPIDHVLPLAQAAEAHRLIEGRRTTGKIVLKPWASG